MEEILTEHTFIIPVCLMPFSNLLERTDQSTSTFMHHRNNGYNAHTYKQMNAHKRENTAVVQLYKLI